MVQHARADRSVSLPGLNHAADTYLTDAAGLRPPLKWAGGKRWLVRHLLPMYAPYRHCRLVEPFCGGLAVTLGLRPERALLNDINPHLISFYRWLQRGLTVETRMANDRELYYAHRDSFNRLIMEARFETKQAAELFYFLNRTGFNGLCRFNRGRGLYNVPFGRYSRISYATEFTRYTSQFACWQFRSGHFADLEFSATDFVYADPPYDVPFRQYAREGFDWAEQVALATQLAEHPGPVVLSNQATARIVDLYSKLGYSLQYFEAPRTISRTGDRSRALEVLATRGV